MIVDLTTTWAGPYTAAAGEILQTLDGAMMVSFGAGVPDGIGDPVIGGTMALSPGQVFYARSTTEAADFAGGNAAMYLMGNFAVAPMKQGSPRTSSAPLEAKASKSADFKASKREASHLPGTEPGRLLTISEWVNF